jgi:hypothetical protein
MESHEMKSIAVISYFVCALVFSATLAFAGGSRLEDNNGLNTANVSLDDSFALLGYLKFDDQRGFVLRCGITQMADGSMVEVPSDDQVTVFGIEAAALYEIKTERVNPYVGSGIGYYISPLDSRVDMEPNRIMEKVWDENDSDRGVGFFLMGGVNVPLSEKASIGANAKYFIPENNGNTKGKDYIILQNLMNIREFDLNNLFLSVSLQIKF